MRPFETQNSFTVMKPKAGVPLPHPPAGAAGPGGGGAVIPKCRRRRRWRGSGGIAGETRIKPNFLECGKWS